MLDGKVKEVSIKKGKVSSIVFNHDGEVYCADLTPSEIELKGRVYTKSMRIAKYDLKENKSIWYLNRHVCGAQGFGQGPDDKCHACERNSIELISSSSDDFIIAECYGDYSPELSEILIKEIPSYTKNLERQIKDFF